MQPQIRIIHKDDAARIFPLTTRLIPKVPAVFMIFSIWGSIGPNGLEKVRLRASVVPGHMMHTHRWTLD